MKISLVVRALNEDEHIGRLLAGVERQSVSVQDVILVDSGSTDATIDIATRFGCTVVHIAPQEFSFGRSLNVGIESTEGDIVIVPSAHVYPLRTTWIERLVEALDDPRVGLVYGRQVGGGQTRYSERRVMASWFPTESNRNQSHPFCNNANAAVRRSTWQTYRYDEDLTGLEDLEFAVRIQKEGWKIAYIAEAEVAHIHEESWSQIRNRYRREAIAHREIFHDQAMTIPEALRLVAANVIGDLWSAGEGHMLAGNFKDIVLFRINQFLGTFQGFRQAGPVTNELKQLFYYPAPRSAVEPRDHHLLDVIDYSDLEAIDEGNDRHHSSG
jgi:GT2 family glycosyltransferase